MSLLYLEHHEILDEVNRHRESRNQMAALGTQALELRSIRSMGAAAIAWIRDAWSLRECANGQHSDFTVIHRQTFDLGNGQELSCRIMRCERCGELVNSKRVRPIGVYPETKEPDGGNHPTLMSFRGSRAQGD